MPYIRNGTVSQKPLHVKVLGLIVGFFETLKLLYPCSVSHFNPPLLDCSVLTLLFPGSTERSLYSAQTFAGHQRNQQSSSSSRVTSDYHGWIDQGHNAPQKRPMGRINHAGCI